MSNPRKPHVLWAGALLFSLVACTKTETKTEIITPACSPAALHGVCDTGQTCFEGACVASSSLCSPTNLAGTCSSGTTCFSGGCVLTAQLCSPSQLQGPCLAGNTCFEGGCVATPSLCSTSNLTGICPTGQSCQQGLCAPLGVDPCKMKIYSQQPPIGVDTRQILTIDGLQFKDSSGDGKLDVYEDWRLPEACRAKDLVSKLSVAEKVGLMGETSSIGSGTADGTLAQSTQDRITTGHTRQALIRLGSRTATELATYLNNVQKLCEAQPWSIPFVVTTDPSHGFGQSTSASTGAQSLAASNVVSPWPYPMGLGAINDLAVTRQYGDTVRHEFMAMGFRWQLGPMADLATEPRWARVQNVFGENAFAVANHVRACIEGFQGVGDGGLRNGIAATMKHFPGAGADERGMDSHSRPGKYNVYPGNNFVYHQIPFKAAIDVGVAAVMPCYSIFEGQYGFDPEQTGASFSHGLITDYLKKTLGFTGMVTSDWGTMSTTPWGVESLSQAQRAAQFIHAGSNQFGLDSPTLIQDAYDAQLVNDADLDASAAKILEMTFKLGLFENPYVDASAAAGIVRSPANMMNGFDAQKKAIVILKNAEHSTPAGGFGAPQPVRYLPLDASRYTDANSNGTPDVGEYIDDTDGDGTIEVYFDGVNDDLKGSDPYDAFLGPYDYTLPGNGTHLAIARVSDPAQADIAVLRITARKGTYFGLDDGVPLSFDAPFPGLQTDTGYTAAVKDAHKVIDLFRVRDGYKNSEGTAVPAAKPTLKIILVMHMDRPSVVKPFINGLTTLDETPGAEGTYPLLSSPANTRTDGLGGVDGFLVDFGAYDRAVLDVLFNQHLPTTPSEYAYGQSRLPMEIPSSDAEVNAQYEDLPADTLSPTFGLGAGSTY